MQGLTRLAHDLGVSKWVTFSGWLPHSEVPSRLAAADILVFPSIREFGGGVVLEAMACGTVPIVVDYGGPGELVTAQTGFRIPLGDRGDLVRATKEIVKKITQEPTCVTNLAEAGHQRVSELYTWERKAEQVSMVYGWVHARTGSEPSFFVPDEKLR